MRRVVRLTERDLTRIIKRVISEQSDTCGTCVMDAAKNAGIQDVTQEKMAALIDIMMKGGEPTFEDIKEVLPDFGDLFKGAKFLMNVVSCMDKCKGTGAMM